MSELINEIGNKYGKLIVNVRAKNGKGGNARWECQCSCGEKTIVAGASLRNGTTKSCGCSHYAINEIGNRYTKLVVVERVKNNKNKQARWLCQCDCGRKTIVDGGVLRSGDTKSCGCLRAIKNEAGNRYGKLVVIEQAGKDKHGMRWLCRCDCGGKIVVRGCNLRRKDHVKSCGCLQEFPKGKVAFNCIIAGMKKGAKNRGYEFALSERSAKKIMQQPCFYCGILPEKRGRKGRIDKFKGHGLDRVNNEKGYVVGNVVPCCRNCNRAKGTMTISEFKEWIIRLANHIAV